MFIAKKYIEDWNNTIDILKRYPQLEPTVDDLSKENRRYMQEIGRRVMEDSEKYPDFKALRKVQKKYFKYLWKMYLLIL